MRHDLEALAERVARMSRPNAGLATATPDEMRDELTALRLVRHLERIDARSWPYQSGGADGPHSNLSRRIACLEAALGDRTL